jgi:poly(A) polymerase
LVLERPEHPISRRDIDANVLKVLYRLINANQLAYLVGGGVRDLMLGIRPKDFDIATTAHPHQVRELFRNSRLIGRRFRLVHVFFGPKNIEVATFRRRAEVVEQDDPMLRHDNTFGTPEEDAFRRDFTINALFYDPQAFRVIDFVGGVGDLQSRLIRAIGDPEHRMREDPVRMIRAVRFAAKLDFGIESATREAIETCASDIIKASAPRLVEEIFRTLSSANSGTALVLMEKLGLLDAILPAVSLRLREYKDRLEAAPTVCMMAALGAAIAAEYQASRGFLLACLCAELYLAEAIESGAPHRLNLGHELRARGFSRADTEEARLLLEALGHMLKPSRITRRLVRRPYYVSARRLLEVVAPALDADPAELDRFLLAPQQHHAGHRRLHPNNADDATHPSMAKRRRRRRGGRRRVHRRGTTAEPPVRDESSSP